MRRFFPWLPEWLDLNIMVPVVATVIVIIVGIVVICVALSRRNGGPEQTRLRGISSADEKYYEGQCIKTPFTIFTIFNYFQYTFLGEKKTYNEKTMAMVPQLRL